MRRLLPTASTMGSPVNQYAPFHLWNTVEGMNACLWGGAFQGLSNDFGRPSVRQWSGLAHEEGGAARRAARVAARTATPWTPYSTGGRRCAARLPALSREIGVHVVCATRPGRAAGRAGRGRARPLPSWGGQPSSA